MEKRRSTEGKRSTDKRHEANLQTKASIIRALFHLLGQKEFSDISVTDIVEEAHVARASYYRNFTSKEDILIGMGRMVIEDFEKRIEGIEGGCLSKKGIAFMFRYFCTYRSPLLRLHNAGFTSVYEKMFQEFIARSAADRMPEGMAQYGVAFYTGALFNVYVCWLEGGMKESPEDLAVLFHAMTSAAFDAVR